ncbi:hypothetical protein [Microbacterium enclense]|uniref:hypothetical protein n=1 Tax=Microbacterium enclense TaxID=993073 RepID=UPI003D749E81
MTRGSAPAVLSAASTFAELRYPDSFAATETASGGLLLTYSAAVGFSPTVELLATPSSSPLADATSGILRAASERHPSALVVGADGWDYSVESDASLAHRLTVVAEEGAVDVVTVTYVWATGREHVSLVARAVPSQLHVLGSTFDWIAAQVVLRASADAVLEAARGEGGVAIERALSTRAGFPLPVLPSSAAFVSIAPRLTGDERTALIRGVGKARIGASHGILPRPSRGTEVAQRLREAGLIDEQDRLTADSAVVGQALFRATQVLAARVRRGGRDAVLVAYVAPGGCVVVVHDPTVAEQEAGTLVDESDRFVAVMDAEKLPRFLCSWVGLTPFWPFGDEASATIDDIDRRVARGATDVLVQRPGASLYDLVTTDGTWQRVGPPEDGIHPLRTDPTRAFFDSVLAFCAQAFA